MADLQVSLRISANGDLLVAEVDKAKRAVKGLGDEAKRQARGPSREFARVQAELRTPAERLNATYRRRAGIINSNTTAEAGLRKTLLLRAGADRAAQQASLASATAFRAAAGAAAGGVIIAGLIRQTDLYTQVTNSIRLATNSAGEYAHVQGELFAISQRTRQPLEEVAALYQKIAISQVDLGASSTDILRVIEGVGQALIVNGTAAAQARGALLQFSQALSSDIVRAEEFNSILEGAKPILITVANNLDKAGGSVGKLRREVIEGKVTSQEFFQAFKRGLPDLQNQFENANSTIRQGLLQVRNSFTQLVGQMDEAEGVSSTLSAAFADFAEVLADTDPEQLAKTLDNLVTIGAILGGVVGVRLVLALTRYSLATSASTVATQAFSLAQTRAAARADVFNFAKRQGASSARRYASAITVASVAVRGFSRAAALLTGPLGILAAIAFGLFQISRGAEEGSQALKEYQRILGEVDNRQTDAQFEFDPTGERARDRRFKIQVEVELRRDTVELAKDELTKAADELEAVIRRHASRQARANARHARRGASFNPEEADREITAATLKRVSALEALDQTYRELGTTQEKFYAEEASRRTDAQKARTTGTDQFGNAPGEARPEITPEFIRLQRDLQTPLERINDIYEGRLDVINANTRAEDTLRGKLLARADLEKQTALDRLTARGGAGAGDEERLRRQLETDEETINRIYRDRIKLITQTTAYTQQEKTDFAARAAEEKNAALADLEARRIAESAARAREAEEAAAAVRREGQEIELLELQGFHSRLEAEEAGHRERLLNEQFKNAPKINKVVQGVAEFERKTGVEKVKSGLQLANEAFGNFAAQSKKAFRLQQVTGIAQALIATYQGIALSQTLPPPASWINAGLVAASGYAQVNAIRNQPQPQAFARGGIVDDPTFFRARGVPLGVAGEAGPEAILPLRRGRDGRLGVQQTGGGMIRPITVNVSLGDINVRTAADDPAAFGDAVAGEAVERIRPYIREVIRDEHRSGGQFNPTNRI